MRLTGVFTRVTRVTITFRLASDTSIAVEWGGWAIVDSYLRPSACRCIRLSAHYPSVFMPPPLGAGCNMFSDCPSVRSPKYPLSACTWVRWSIRPTVTVFRPVRPSVRPDRFPGISPRTYGGNGLKFCMLMYPDHIQNLIVYGHVLLIFLLLSSLLLSEVGQICGFRAFPGERMGECPAILHADVSWPPSELMKFWSWSVDFPPLGITLT